MNEIEKVDKHITKKFIPPRHLKEELPEGFRWVRASDTDEWIPQRIR